MRIAALIAAAGKSRRMGSPKALLKMAGTTFVRHLACRLIDAGIEDLVITIPECTQTAQRVRDELLGYPQIDFCRNLFPERELLGSVQTALLQKEKLDALIIMPIDVPAPSINLLSTFRDCAHINKILCAANRGDPVHPLLLGASFFAEALALHPNDSLRTLLSRHLVTYIESGDANLSLNINTPEDYARFTNPSARKLEAAAIEAPGLKSR